jgi:hypothetical protein
LERAREYGLPAVVGVELLPRWTPEKAVSVDVV